MSRRVLLHYYHAGSLGHGQRIMALARGLKEQDPDCDVVVAAGGVPVPEVVRPRGVEWLQLPALTSSAETSFALRPATLSLPLEQVLRLRRDLLLTLARRLRPHALVTDLFPFGRRFLAGELLPLCRMVRRLRPSARVVCSMRDLLGQPSTVYDPATARRAGRELCQLFDAALVHGDPAVLTAEEDLNPGGALPPGALERLIYSGYLVGLERSQLKRRSPLRARHGVGLERWVVVSAGGGADGGPLLHAAARAEALLNRDGPAYRLLLLHGPFLADQERARLMRLARARPSLRVERHAAGLVHLINAADLSVSMGGYNTCAELLLTGTPGIIVPRTSWEEEQLIRARALEARGWASVLPPGDLTPAALASAMEATLDAAPQRRRRPRVNVEGARFSARYILGSR